MEATKFNSASKLLGLDGPINLAYLRGELPVLHSSYQAMKSHLVNLLYDRMNAIGQRVRLSV